MVKEESKMADYNERVPLKTGDRLELKFRIPGGAGYARTAQVEEWIGQGASCMTYIVRLTWEGGRSVRMIMKEFYPSDWEGDFEIWRKGTVLHVSDRTKVHEKYIEAREEFKESFAMQQKLSDSEAMEVMVRPYHLAECGDSLYILSDMHLGGVLKGSEPKTLQDKLWVIFRTAEAVNLLHEQGYLYMDLNPRNILWIESHQTVRLFDVDSIIPYRNLEAVHEIKVTRPYVAPELTELESWFEINKSMFLTPAWDVYCVGLIIFELLFGRFPSEEERAAADGKDGELEDICFAAGCKDPSVCEGLRRILRRCLSKSFRIRYSSAQQICDAVNEVKRQIDAQEFITRKEYVRANYMLESYYMLDKWPVYHYSRRENGKEVMDVAVVGGHSMREPFFRAVYSCVHTLDSVLRIRIYSEDAKEFLEELEKKNPAFAGTVRVYQEDELIRDEIDGRICEEPIAEIYLYERSIDELLEVGEKSLENTPSSYVLFMEEDEPSVRRAAKLLGKSGESRLLGYLDNGAGKPAFQEDRLGNVTVVPVSMRKKCDYYDEDLIRSRLMGHALNVHALYSRGRDERMPREKIRQSFEADAYNMESSVRSALSVRYKLASVDPQGDVQSQAEAFLANSARDEGPGGLVDRLAVLEHLSWCAYMIINGWSLPTDEEIEAYAFIGGNDFKDRERKLHPCLVSSRPGSTLDSVAHKVWDQQKPNRKTTGSLDSLDLMSLKLHKIARRKAEDTKEETERHFAALRRRLQPYQDSRLWDDFNWLETVKDRVYAGESNSEVVWGQAYGNLVKTCTETGICDRSIQRKLEEINNLLKVAHEYNEYHDFKKSDIEIIKGIPFILSEGTVKRVVRPHIKGLANRWKNILATLCLEPEELVFLAENEEEPDTEFYKEFLALRGCGTKIRVCSPEEIGGTEGRTALDVTGLDAQELYALENHEALAGTVHVMLKDGKLITVGALAEKIYERQIHLTVEETFFLFGAYMESDKKANIILSLGSRYRNIWNAYIKIRAWGWRVLIDKLKSAEEKNIYMLSDARSGKQTYTTEAVLGDALVTTNMDIVLEQCRQEGLIDSYQIPAPQDELSAQFTTDRGNAAGIIKKLIQFAGREPLKHHFVFRRRDRSESHKELAHTEYSIYDRTLYVHTAQRNETAENLAGKKENRADLIRTALETLAREGEQGGQQKLIQNLQIRQAADRIDISFKYASTAVKECLQREGNILEAMIYFTCLNAGIFDDLNINSEFCWNTDDDAVIDEYTVNNEIDIIGTKNMKTYFISAKMAFPENEHLMEIKYFADYFGIEGQAILVTSNHLTKDSSVNRPIMREERSRLMGVEYINRTVIDEGRLEAAIREIVEKSQQSEI